MLKIRYNNRQQDPFWIMERNFSIGSTEDNHLVLQEPSVAPHHVKITRDVDSILLRELSQEHTTLVNGRQIFKNRQISCGDIISIGDVELEIVDPIEDTQAHDYWSLIGDSSWLAGQEFPLIFHQKKPLLLGRGKHCDIVFPGTHLSREHASISRTDSGLILQDLKSANATFVNDERITNKTIEPGDRVRFDVYSFRVFGPGIELHKSATKKFKAVTIDKPANTPRPSPKAAINTKKENRERKERRLAHLTQSNMMSVKRTPLTNWLLALLLITFITSITAHVVLGSFVGP